MKRIDARFLACPMPVVLTRRAIADDTQGHGVEVVVNDEIAAQNIEKMAGQCAWSCVRDTQGADIILTVRAARVEDVPVKAAKHAVEAGLCIAFGEDQMGAGDDALGKQLLKAFLFALTQRDKAPETMLFYHGGARLTCEGSSALEDIMALEKMGTQVYTCGACLNYYGITEDLRVGEVTNMYAIAERMIHAQKLVKP